MCVAYNSLNFFPHKMRIEEKPIGLNTKSSEKFKTFKVFSSSMAPICSNF